MTPHLTRRDLLRLAAVSPSAFTGLLRDLSAVDHSLKPASEPKTVIVIGAGLAGLMAGYELVRAGHRVTILEAQQRAGGRVYTLREPFADGLYVDAGASQIPANHYLTLKYVRLFGLELVRARPSDQASVRWIGGQRLPVMPGETFHWPFDLTPEERELGPEGLMEKYFLRIPRHQDQQITVSPDWIPPELRQHDRVSFAEFLLRQGASPGAVQLLGFGYYDLWGEGTDEISALMLMREIRHQFSHDQPYAIKGGNDQLPKRFARELADKIRYGAPVVRIEQGPRGVRAAFEQGGLPHTIGGDYLICGIPFSVLKNVAVSPPFPPEKQRVIEQLPYMSISRVYLQSRRRYWMDQGFSGDAAIDAPPTIIADETRDQEGPRGILHSFMARDQARRVAAMPERDRIDYAVNQVEQIYPGMRENLEGGVSKCWDEDPWARGAAAWFKPGQMIDFLPHIGRPVGRIHFAGEHISPWPGWMQGALQSGLRVAREVHEAVV